MFYGQDDVTPTNEEMPSPLAPQRQRMSLDGDEVARMLRLISQSTLAHHQASHAHTHSRTVISPHRGSDEGLHENTKNYGGNSDNCAKFLLARIFCANLQLRHSRNNWPEPDSMFLPSIASDISAKCSEY